MIGADSVRSNFAKQGIPISLKTPAEVAIMLRAEVKKWAAVIDTAHVTVD